MLQRKMLNIDKIYGWVVMVHLLVISVTVQSAVVNSFDRSYSSGVFVIYASGIGEPIVEKEMPSRPSLEEYKKARSALYSSELARAIGSKLPLNEREMKANAIFKKIKRKDMEEGFENPLRFAPAHHFFDVLDEIKSSSMFKLIKKMPKGAVLHAHDIALCSSEYVLSLTYLPDLWQCGDPSSEIQFQFSRDEPTPVDGCKWTLVSQERAKGSKEYDEKIKKVFTLYTENPLQTYRDINEVWDKFTAIFKAIAPIVTYKPVWKAYYKQALKEFYEDGVLYLEFRGTLPNVYDLDGNIYEGAEVVQIYYDAVNEFKKENPGFIGSKMIYAPVRKVDDETFAEYMKMILQLQDRFPDFIAGFDVVAQEDCGRPLVDFAEHLLKLPSNINFFFHAGETNWNGMSTDENLWDAVLLGTKRIGHGYAVVKHPSVLELIKSKGIAIELNPISNQVLKLNDDNRNHPGAFLMSDDYPLVISSDDPSFWEATPLTHDFYIAFMGLASAHADLRTLKQFAINSLTYSAMNAAEKEIAFRKWQHDWDKYIEWVISSEEGNDVNFRF